MKLHTFNNIITLSDLFLECEITETFANLRYNNFITKFRHYDDDIISLIKIKNFIKIITETKFFTSDEKQVIIENIPTNVKYIWNNYNINDNEGKCYSHEECTCSN
jgi:hypothetical protein